MAEHLTVGPIELAVIEFPGSKFQGDIVPAIIDLIDSGTVALLDLVVVLKDPDGNVSSLELWDLDDELKGPFDAVEGEVGGMLSEDDIALIAESLDPGSTAGVIVWENTWSRPFVTAIQAAGGKLVAHDRIDAETAAAALASLKEEATW